VKNATLKVLLMLALGIVPAASAAAQADDAEGDDVAAPAEPDQGTVEEAPAEEAPADGAASDQAAAEEAPADDAAAEATPADADEAQVEEAPEEAPVEDAPAEEATPAELDAPVEAPAEAPVEEAEPETASGLDTPEEAEPAEDAAEEEAEKPLPWRNTFFNYTNQVTFNSFLRDAQLSYNPLWQMSFSVLPRWYVEGAGFFRANLGLSLEVTDTDGNALNREPLFNDITVDYFHILPWEGFVFMPQVRVTIPASRSSLAAQRYLATGLGVTVVRVIPEAGNLTLAGIFRYTRWWAGSNVVQVGEPQPDRCPVGLPQPTGGGLTAPELNTTTCDQLGTSSSASDIILAGLSATMTPIGPLSINLSAFMFTTQGYGLAPAYIDVATSAEPVRIDDGSPNHFRNFTYLSLSVAYQAVDWLNLSLGIQNAGAVAPLYNPDGNVRNPIFTPDTQVFLTATIGLDAVYGNLFGGHEELTPEELQRRQQGLAQGPSAGGTF